MTELTENPFHSHMIDAEPFLERARLQLNRFDEGELPALFYAAYELRAGIESRLHTYVKATYGKKELPKSWAKTYAATKLLNQLKNVSPNVDRESVLTITNEQTGAGFALRFTPVTPQLASMHGQLGSLLHFTFFLQNPDWMHKPIIKSVGETLDTVRTWLGEVADELEVACRGNLLAPPEFQRLVKQIEKGGRMSDEDPL